MGCVGCRYRLEVESELHCKQTELSQWEARLQRDQEKIASLRTDLATLTTELQTERDKTTKLQSLLQEAMGRQLTLQEHKDYLQQRLDKVC